MFGYEEYLKNVGPLLAYIVVYIIIFAESGILIGFFLPGDSFLVTIGLLAATGYLNILVILVLGSVAAITGDSVGYWFGRKVGPALFTREDSRFFKKAYLKKAHDFYERHGSKTIVIARFVPFVRTFAPIIAGMAKMNYPKFLLYNIVGGIGWVFSIALLGYFLGRSVENIDVFILPIIIGIIVVSVLPGAIPIVKMWLKRFRSNS